MAFIPNMNGKPQINHIDRDKSNNEAINLEWVTNAENIEHAQANVLHDNGPPVIKVLLPQILTAVFRGYLIKDIAVLNGVSEKTIRRHLGDEVLFEPITTLKVGRKINGYYYSERRKAYRLNDHSKQFGTRQECIDYIESMSVGGFAANRELAIIAGRKGGLKSRRNKRLPHISTVGMVFGAELS